MTLNDADKDVRDTYLENRDDMTNRGLRELVVDIFDEIEERETTENGREVAKGDSNE